MIIAGSSLPSTAVKFPAARSATTWSAWEANGPGDAGEVSALLQRRQAEQHRGQDARPVPALAVRPRHPQPQGDHDQADDYPHRDDERSELGRGKAVAQEPPAGGGL